MTYTESFEIIIYFPLGGECGQLYNFTIKKDETFEDIWSYWYQLYATQGNAQHYVESWCDLLGSVPDEIYDKLKKEVDPLNPEEMTNAMKLLKMGIKYIQETVTEDNKLMILTHSIEDL